MLLRRALLPARLAYTENIFVALSVGAAIRQLNEIGLQRRLCRSNDGILRQHDLFVVSVLIDSARNYQAG